MKKNTFYLLLFLIFSTLGMKSQTNYFLEGQLGKNKIYLNFNSDNSELDGSYFYRNSLKNIPLEGAVNNGKFVLKFENHFNKIFEKFELSKSSKTSFKGFWTNQKGKKIPLILTVINFSKFPHNFAIGAIGLINEFDLIKLSLLEFKPDSVSKFHGKELIWYSEKHCKSPFFRLGDNFSERNKSVINPILNTIQIQNTLAQLDCSSGFEYNTGDGIEYTVNVNYMNDNLLGFKIFSSWFCGGAHPDFGGRGYLLDLNNGKEYDIDAILAFDKTVTNEIQGGFDAYSAYRQSYFAPKLFELINNHTQLTNETERDCDYTDLEIWNFPSWNFTEEGIEFTPTFYRAARACEEPFLVPFESLKQFKNPKYPYTF